MDLIKNWVYRRGTEKRGKQGVEGMGIERGCLDQRHWFPKKYKISKGNI